jgi:NADH-quinone oxidoreductase subunit A
MSGERHASGKGRLTGTMLASYIPIVVVIAVAVAVGALLLFLARALGPHRPSPAKGLPYECGMDQETTPRIRFSVQFYRIALLFLVFDIEAAFFYPWAVRFKELSCTGPMVNGVCQGQTSPAGLIVMLVFLAILLLALLFVWRRKALEWD